MSDKELTLYVNVREWILFRRLALDILVLFVNLFALGVVPRRLASENVARISRMIDFLQSTISISPGFKESFGYSRQHLFVLLLGTGIPQRALAYILRIRT